jgi:hypothetical protein
MKTTSSKKMILAGVSALALAGMVGAVAFANDDPTTNAEAGTSSKIMYFNASKNKMNALKTIEVKTDTSSGTTTGVSCYLGTGIGVSTESTFTLNPSGAYLTETAFLSSGAYFASCNFFIFAKNISVVESIFATSIATTNSSKIKYTSSSTPSGSDIAGTGVDFASTTDYKPTNCNGVEIVYTFSASTSFTLTISSLQILWTC